MFVYIVLVSALVGKMEPWGVYSTLDLARIEQQECQRTYRSGRSGSVFGMENCEIWQYRVDGAEKIYRPSPD